MNFDIQSHPLMEGKPHCISLPHRLRVELGVLVGQFLQLRGKQALVLEICTALNPNQEVAYLATESFEKIQNQDLSFEILEVTLGCDPEFFIIWGFRNIVAATYLPFQGEVGCDGALGELRPMYGRHEDQVIRNLQKLIPEIPRRMHRSKWATSLPITGDQFTYEAHSYHSGIAAGFHVHLGIPPEILNTRKDFNRAAMSHLVRGLDWFVSVPLVPLEVDHQRRLGRSNYGKPGDYRPSNMTLEYRTPGGFYLRSPKLARGLLGLSLAVTETVVSRMKVQSQEFTKLHKLTEADLHAILPIPKPEKIRSTLEDGNVKVAQTQLPAIYREIQGLPNYRDHQGAIEEFFSAVEAQERPGPNLLHNWKE